MAARDVLTAWVVEALAELGGSATPLEVSRAVWIRREQELRDAGDLFYTWQYDIRWAALKLRKEGVLVAAAQQRDGRWELAR